MAFVVLSWAETERPIITAAAPPTALRIKKLRRSTPGGPSRESNRLVSANGSSLTTSPSFSVELSLSSNFSFSLFGMVHLLTFIKIRSTTNRRRGHYSDLICPLPTQSGRDPLLPDAVLRLAVLR